MHRPTDQIPSQQDSPSHLAESASAEPTSLSRRRFLGRVGGLAATCSVTGAVGASLTSSASAEAIGPTDPAARRRIARALRERSAAQQSLRPYPAQTPNTDESLYADYRNQYSKGLPHDPVTGEVDPAAYDALVAAIQSGDFNAFEAIPMGGARKLVCPLGAQSYDMVGPDSHHLAIPAAPSMESAWLAGELVEVYWKSLLRDVRFSDYDVDALVQAACADLSTMSDFRGPKNGPGGSVTPGTLFRGFTEGDLVGPYVSQLLWNDIPYGMTTIEQRYETYADGDDRGTSFADWLAIQNGNVPGASNSVPGATRYITTGRDLARYVHDDFSFQAYLNAALILLGLGPEAIAPGNPYLASNTQAAFVSLGGPEVLDMVTKAGNTALKAAWYQKWGVHRRARPEAISGRVQRQVLGQKDYGLHPDVLNSGVLARNFSRYGTYLQSQAYPEGSPTHCSYPAGHSTVAGACVTMLKAFFNVDYILQDPVQPTQDGLALQPYSGAALTIGGELDKLASNISIGRNIAGVHWRTDGDEGMRLGEELAIGILRDFGRTRPERATSLTFQSFDGDTIRI